MTDRTAFLVVGADSLVGGSTIAALKRRGHTVYGTTRRADTVGADRVLLDFETGSEFVAPADVGVALVIAAATDYTRCETDPQARVINVEQVPATVRALLAQGIHTTFISTNSVFGGERPWPDEDAPHDPGLAYAAQKSEGEAAIRAMAAEDGTEHLLNITRLTKILEPDTSPIPSWIAGWEKGETVTPFKDLIFAPMSVQFVGEALASVGEARASGNLHLSGADNVDYEEFARRLARHLGFDDGLVEPTTSVEKGVHIAFLPTYSGLGMTRTTELTGVAPQPLDAALEDIFPGGARPDPKA